MKAENINTRYKTTQSYEKMYTGYYEAKCNYCGTIIARSSECQMGEEGMNQAVATAVEITHSCPEKPPLVER